MRWGYNIPWKDTVGESALTITYEVGDSLVTELHKARKEEGDTGKFLRDMIEFELFLMNANRYRMAVLDQQTLAFIVMNYDNEKEKIIGVFKHLANEMDKHARTTANNSTQQPEPVADADSTI